MATKKTTPKATKATTEKTIPVEKLQEIAQQAAQNPPEAPPAGTVQVNVDFLRTTKVHIATGGNRSYWKLLCRKTDIIC